MSGISSEKTARTAKRKDTASVWMRIFINEGLPTLTDLALDRFLEAQYQKGALSYTQSYYPPISEVFPGPTKVNTLSWNGLYPRKEARACSTCLAPSGSPSSVTPPTAPSCRALWPLFGSVRGTFKRCWGGAGQRLSKRC